MCDEKKNGRVIPCWHATPQFTQLRETDRRVVFIYGDVPQDRHAVLQGWLPKLTTLAWRDHVGFWSWSTEKSVWSVQWLEEGEVLGAPQYLPTPLEWPATFQPFGEIISKKKKKKTRETPRHIVVVQDVVAADELDALITALPPTVGLCLISIPNLLMVSELAWRSCGTVVIVPHTSDTPDPSPAACLLAARWPQSVLAVQAFEQRCAERAAQLTLMVWVVGTRMWYWTALSRGEALPLLATADVYTEVTALLDAIAQDQPVWAERCAAAIVALHQKLC
jgi:hypothetical protein